MGLTGKETQHNSILKSKAQDFITAKMYATIESKSAFTQVFMRLKHTGKLTSYSD